MTLQSSPSKEQIIIMREKIIYNQLKKVLPLSVEPINILFCAHEFRKQHDVYIRDLNYKKN